MGRKQTNQGYCYTAGRKRHLIEVHKYPKTFKFGTAVGRIRPNEKKKKKKPVTAAAAVQGETDAMECAVAPQRSIPSSFSFGGRGRGRNRGGGGGRGFGRGRGQGQGRVPVCFHCKQEGWSTFETSSHPCIPGSCECSVTTFHTPLYAWQDNTHLFTRSTHPFTRGRTTHGIHLKPFFFGYLSCLYVQAVANHKRLVAWLVDTTHTHTHTHIHTREHAQATSSGCAR